METLESGGGKGPVCVTGGSGFIGSWLIMKLLHHGYTVHATLRSLGQNHESAALSTEQKHRDISFLTTLPGASDNLKLFEADLTDPTSFTPAIQGCAAVIHVATPGINSHSQDPTTSSEEEGEDAIVERSVSGTLGILKACLDSKTVKRVVYTSGSSAVVHGGRRDVETVDESFWSDVVEYGKTAAAAKSRLARLLVVSKTVTERKALEFGERHGLDVVTLIPSIVVGPFVCPKFPGSVRLALAMVLGEKDECGKLEASMVHVDDVARAYIFLLTNPQAKGRFICSSHTVTAGSDSDLMASLRVKYPGLTVPAVKSLKDILGVKRPKLSSKKLLEAGFEFKYGIDDMFDEAIKCCIDQGYL